MTLAVVIVGAGQAGLQLASSLRENGFCGRICILGDEAHPPYQRPPLSKAFLSGTFSQELLWMQEPDYFAQNAIDFRPSTRVRYIDREARMVETVAGSIIPYDKLILAIGARNRTLQDVTDRTCRSHSIRSLDDSRSLRAALATAKRMVIVGAGFLGLEVAAVARAANIDVDIVESGPLALGRAVSSITSRALQEHHEKLGSNFHFGETVADINSESETDNIRLSSGKMLQADSILVAIGVEPNVELAASAALEVRNGIVVDHAFRTSDPDIYAIGDCATFSYGHAYQRLVRLESVQNAVDHARAVALNIIGLSEEYDQVPLFWSDQAGLRLQIAGVADPTDRAILRADLVGETASIFRFRDERLVAVESINRPGDHMQARKLLKTRAPLRPEEAEDPDFSLKALNERHLSAGHSR